MRIRLTLDHADNIALPIDYRAALSAWIYGMIGRSDSHFSRELHERGFVLGNRKFKLFTFGQLKPQRYEARGGTFRLSQGPTEIDLSFFVDEAARHLIMGLFQDQEFYLGSEKRPVWFRVKEMRTLPEPNFALPWRLRFLTPCCISRADAGDGPAQYLPPDDPEFGERFFRNLRNKQAALREEKIDPSSPLDFDYSFQLLGAYRSRLHRIHDMRIRGFLFECRLDGPEELLRIGYYGGFGEKGAGLGFGFGVLGAER